MKSRIAAFEGYSNFIISTIVDKAIHNIKHCRSLQSLPIPPKKINPLSPLIVK